MFKSNETFPFLGSWVLGLGSGTAQVFRSKETFPFPRTPPAAGACETEKPDRRIFPAVTRDAELLRSSAMIVRGNYSGTMGPIQLVWMVKQIGS